MCLVASICMPVCLSICCADYAAYADNLADTGDRLLVSKNQVIKKRLICDALHQK